MIYFEILQDSVHNIIIKYLKVRSMVTAKYYTCKNIEIRLSKRKADKVINEIDDYKTIIDNMCI